MEAERDRAEPVMSFPLLEEAGEKRSTKVINLDMALKGRREGRDHIMVYTAPIMDV
jgi:hypothetical protein